MIDPERLIGGLLNGALEGNFGGKKKRKRSKRYSKSGFLGGNKGMVGMGLLGLAFAAYDHYSKTRTGGSSSSGPYTGGTPGGSAPPPPPAPSASPPPTHSVPPPPPGADIEDREQEALLILRAMVAAANADYSIDAEERQGILDKAQEAGLSPEEMKLIAEELDHPKGMADIVREVRTSQQAEEVYVASLLAIDVDTEAEIAYLKALAQRLKLNADTVKKWHDQLEISLDGPSTDVIH